MTICRPPARALRPVIAAVWASDATAAPVDELALPTGCMHLVFRLGDTPMLVSDGAHTVPGQRLDAAVVGGVRAAAYRKVAVRAVATVGLVVRPGAREPLSGTPAGALAGAHTGLDDLIPPAVVAHLDSLLRAADSGPARLRRLEEFLVARLDPDGGVPPLVAHALRRLAAGDRVGALVADTGLSHRHVARVFEEAAGIGPKTFGRLMRFRRALRRCRRCPEAGWAEIAATGGFADQAHLGREFLAFAGITPGHYRRLAPLHPHHVPLSCGGRSPEGGGGSAGSA